MKRTLFFLLSIVIIVALSCSKSTGVNSKEDDAEELRRQRESIVAQAQSEPCTDASEWKSLDIGVKSCGGPDEYIAYHRSVNMDELGKKVEEYNEAMRAFIEKYDVSSDCAVEQAPAEIVCEGGKPVLKP